MPRAVVCRELGAPETLRVETVCATPLAPGKVRVAIRAAGINFPDILMVAGEYQFKPELPFTPGMEAAGDIIEVGKDLRGFKAKDRVIVKLRHGGYADEVAVTPEHIVPLPSTFDYAEGATFLAAHGTAYHALVDRAQKFRRWYRARWLDIFKSVDAVIAPATPCVAPELGQTTFVLDGVEMPVRANIGIATSGPGRDTATALLRAGDAAQYQAKAAGNGMPVIYTDGEA